MSQNSYLRELCEQVSQLVFLADVTVLRLITTVLAKISQIMFLVEMTVLRLNTTVWFKNVTKLIFFCEFCAILSQIVFLGKMSQNSYLRWCCPQVSQNVFLADLTVLRLITIVWAK